MSKPLWWFLGFALAALSTLSAGVQAQRRGEKSIPSQRYDWKSVPIVAGGFISGLIFHPNAQGLAYARTDIGGAYRWNEASQRWIPLLDWLTKPDRNLYGIEAMAIDPTNIHRLYLACGTYTNSWGSNGAILSSIDQGRTFKRADLPFKLGGNEDGRSMGERLAVDPTKPNLLYFGTRNNGLWLSEDFGRTWSQVSSFPVSGRTNGIGVTSVAFDPAGQRRGKKSQSIYVGVASNSHNLYHSSDGGVTWETVDTAPQGMFVHHMICEAGQLFLTFSAGAGPNGISDGAVFRYDTVAKTWNDITPVRPNLGKEKGFGYAGLSLYKSTIVVSTLDRWEPGDDVFYSTDYGRSWAGLKKSSYLDPTSAPYMTWGQKSPRFGWWIGAVAVDPYDTGRVLYGTGANIWGSEDVLPSNVGLTTRWTIKGVGIEETADIDLLSPPAGPHLITALGDIGGFTHQDLTHPPSGMALNPMLSNTDSLAASLIGNVIVKVGRPDQGEASGGVSHDSGLSWKAFGSAPKRGSSGGSVAISLDGKIVVWSPSRSGPSWSIDDGATWHQSVSNTENLQLVADPKGLNTFYGLGASGRIYMSSDGGKTFAQSSQEEFKGDHGPLKIDPLNGHLYLPSASGLFISVDGGKSFQPMLGVDSADSIGFGRAKPGHTDSTIFVNGKIAEGFGVFRSDDAGSSWVRITDVNHEYGTRGVVIGDPRIYGRVYMGTNGRGVLYGDPVGLTPSH